MILLSPGVAITELDLSQGIDGTATSIGVAVFESKQGPVSPTYITNRDDFLALYGNPDPSVSYGHDTALAFLKQSASLWCNRVVNNALHSGKIFYQDSQLNPTRTLAIDFPVGLANSYVTGNHKIMLLKTAGVTSTANHLSVDITDGTTSRTAEASFTTDSNTTLANFATAVQTQLDLFATGGTAKVVKEYIGTSIKEQLKLALSTSFVTGNQLAFNLNIKLNSGVISTQSVSVTYSTNHLTTINLLKTNIQTALNAVSTGGNCYLDPLDTSNLTLIIESPISGINTITLTDIVVTGTFTAISTINKQGAGVNDDRIITAVFPQGVDLLLENFGISGGTPPSSSIEEDVELFEVFSENPGTWANDYGVKISNIDQGINQISVLTISSPFITGNVINGQINGVTISPTTFATDSDTTLASLAAAIDSHLKSTYSGKGSAEVISIANSTSNDRQIKIIAPDSLTTLTFSTFIVTGGSDQCSISIAETLKRVPTTNTFKLEVYYRNNIMVPVEAFTVSLKEQVDGFGNQQNIAQVINFSGNKSKFIRIGQQKPYLSNVKVLTPSALVAFLYGGDNGQVATSGQIIAGWNALADKEKYEIRILMNCGYQSVSIKQYITSMAEARQDCIAILDAPSDVQAPQDLANYRQNTLNINSSYAALYSPDFLITDEFTNVQRYVPPSGYIAASYAYTDRVSETWFSPAGLNRGIINNILGLKVLYNKGHLDLTYPLQINSVKQFPGQGFAVFGDKTLQSKNSALSYVPVRRLLILIASAVEKALDFSVFEPNDDFTRNTIVQILNNFFGPIQDRRGLQQYEVVCSAKNNLPADIDAGRLNVDIYLTPSLPSEYISVRLIVTNQGASFQALGA